MQKLNITRYKHKILTWIAIAGIFYLAFYFGIDKNILLFIVFIIGVVTEIFAGLGALIAAIPIIGPMIIKVISIPFFLILNALGTLVSGIAIKKGYTAEFAKGRIITLALLIGIIIGYIIGNIVPL